MMTVIIATRNGSRTVPDLLDTYCRLQDPPGGWKLVVIDNNSTDNTREILDSYLGKLPLTCLFEERPGKNRALNAGLSKIEGDLVLFTDDDAFPRTDWLVQMRASADLHKTYTVFGGIVVPRWENPPPDWLLKWVPGGAVFSLTPPLVQDGPTTPYYVFGPNMGVRAGVFSDGECFDESIGPRPGQYPMGGESEFVRRLARNGHAIWMNRGAVVEHFIRQFQMRKSWILGRAIRFGRGQWRLNPAAEALSARSWFGIPPFLIRGMLNESARWMGAILRYDREGAFRARWELNYLRGHAVESKSMWSDIRKRKLEGRRLGGAEDV